MPTRNAVRATALSLALLFVLPPAARAGFQGNL